MNKKYKRCSRCKEELWVVCFNKNASQPDGYDVICKPCKKERNAEHYLRKKGKISDQRKISRMISRDEVNTLISLIRSAGCSFCDETTECCLEFHHVDPATKKRSPTNFEHVGDHLFEELEKCILVCANCHKKIHAGILKVSPQHPRCAGHADS